jgi:hypothetical protein
MAEPGEQSTPAPASTPAVKFAALNASAYDQLMGRWSRKRALLLVQFGGLADGDRVPDVGCGTGKDTQSRLSARGQAD